MKYHWHDERVGRWTRVEFEGDGVTFHLGKNHYAGALVGTLMTSGIASLILSAVVGNRNWFFVLFPMSLPVFGFKTFRKLKRQHNDFPIRVADCADINDGGRLIRTSDVATVLVRENSGRDHTEDQAMAQIYLLLSGGEYPILVHQHYLVRRAKVIGLAQRIADHLHAKLEVELDFAK